MKKILSVVLLIGIAVTIISFAPATPKDTDKKNFQKFCSGCHGNTGTLGVLGATNLQTSRLADKDMVITITKGRNKMPAWESTLSPKEIEGIVNYIRSLRK